MFIHLIQVCILALGRSLSFPSARELILVYLGGLVCTEPQRGVTKHLHECGMSRKFVYTHKGQDIFQAYTDIQQIMGNILRDDGPYFI